MPLSTHTDSRHAPAGRSRVRRLLHGKDAMNETAQATRNAGDIGAAITPPQNDPRALPDPGGLSRGYFFGRRNGAGHPGDWGQVDPASAPVSATGNGPERTPGFHRVETSAEPHPLVLSDKSDSRLAPDRRAHIEISPPRRRRSTNIASINSQKDQFGEVDYSAAPTGMIGSVKALDQKDAGRGIAVDAICPCHENIAASGAGPNRDRQTIVVTVPTGPLGLAEDLVDTARRIASREKAFRIGSVPMIHGDRVAGG